MVPMARAFSSANDCDLVVVTVSGIAAGRKSVDGYAKGELVCVLDFGIAPTPTRNLTGCRTWDSTDIPYNFNEVVESAATRLLKSKRYKYLCLT